MSRITGNPPSDIPVHGAERGQTDDKIAHLNAVRPAATPTTLNPLAVASMVATIRRPPMLKDQRRAKFADSKYDKILKKYALPLSHLSSDELAFVVSHMVFRREAEITPGQSDEILSGFAALGQLARMYEHLAILQSGPTEG